MGYVMRQRAANFHIRAIQKQDALAAVKALAIYRRYSYIEHRDYATAPTLEEALTAWGWTPMTGHVAAMKCPHCGKRIILDTTYSDTASHFDITGIRFDREKLGDEAILFNAIAPFVEAGSWIEMVGENGEIWRWVFDGRTCREQQAQVRFE